MARKLGALGFLSTQTEEAAGNAGLKDVLLALKWVKNNIEKFGGDSNNITLGGGSSGAAVVHYILLSKQSKGLYNRALMMSGSVLSYKHLDNNPVKSTKAFGARLGFKTDNLDELVKKLQKVNVFEIVEAQPDKLDKRAGIRSYAPFLPVVEQKSDHAILTKSPLEVMKTFSPNVSLIVGFNLAEGISNVPVIRNKYNAEYLNRDFELCVPSNIGYPYGSKESIKLARQIKEFYLHGNNITESTLQGYINMESDMQIIFSVDKWVKIYKEMNNASDVFYYLFDFDGDFNWNKIRTGTRINGTAHGDEMGYFFVTSATKPLFDTASEASKETLDITMNLWSNFIKYGNPTPKLQLTPDVIVNWTDCGTERNFLLLNNRPTMVHGPPLQERLSFWYKVYDDYNHYVKSGGILEPKTP